MTAIVIALISLIGMVSAALFTFITARRQNETMKVQAANEGRKVDTEDFQAFIEAQNQMMDRIKADHEKCEQKLEEQRKQTRELWQTVRTQEAELARCTEKLRRME